jgi:hypothetical protein
LRDVGRFARREVEWLLYGKCSQEKNCRLWVTRFGDEGVGVPGICVRKGSVIR